MNELINEIQKLQQGDYGSSQNFYNLTVNAFWGQIKSKVVDEQLAQTILNESYNDIYREIGSLTNLDDFWIWSERLIEARISISMQTGNIITPSEKIKTVKGGTGIGVKIAIGILVAAVVAGGIIAVMHFAGSSKDKDNKKISEEVADDKEKSEPDETEEKTTAVAVEEKTTEEAVETTTEATTEELVTITAFDQKAGYMGEQMGWSAEVLKDALNITLNIVPDVGDVDYSDIANLGDILIINEARFKDAANNGSLYDWNKNDLLNKYGKYISEHVSIPLNRAKSLADDNNIYGMPIELALDSNDTQGAFYTWDIRWDLYKELGHPEVNDLDDLYNILVKMKEICPKDAYGNPTYALTMWPDWDGNMVMYPKSLVTAYYGYDEFGMGFYNSLTGEYYSQFDENSPYITMLKFLNKLYMADLIDPDSRTLNYDKVIEKIYAGGDFLSIFNYAGSGIFNNDVQLSQGMGMYSLIPNNARPGAYGLNPYGSIYFYAISANAKNPEKCMELINYLTTPEGHMTITYGPKGETWDYDGDGNTYLTELGKKAMEDRFSEIGDYGIFNDGECQLNAPVWNIDASNPNSNAETYNYINWKLENPISEYEILADWQNHTGCNSVDMYFKSREYCVLPYSNYVMSRISDEQEDLIKKVTSETVDLGWQAIYAENDAEFDRIIGEMVNIGRQEGMEEIENFYREEAKKKKQAEDEIN